MNTIKKGKPTQYGLGIESEEFTNSQLFQRRVRNAIELARGQCGDDAGALAYLEHDLANGERAQQEREDRWRRLCHSNNEYKALHPNPPTSPLQLKIVSSAVAELRRFAGMSSEARSA